MAELNRCVLSIAGYDPSGGAGVIADAKTFEGNHARGMAIISALTFQNDSEFDQVKWISTADILQQYDVLRRKFEFAAIKIGLVENFEVLQAIVDHVKASSPQCFVVWDPILKASAGYEFHQEVQKSKLAKLLGNMSIVTPNTEEAMMLSGESDEQEAAKALAKYTAILLKGGHSQKEPGTDYLFAGGEMHQLKPFGFDASPKHGSGCVLSAAIAAHLSKGEDVKTACRKAKEYTQKFLSSNTDLLGTHYV